VLVLLLAAGVWFATNSTAAMLAVLVASCPCALVLAAPATAITAIAVAGRHGILVKGAAFLEDLAGVDSVVLDKTGTVTLGELRVIEVRPEPGVEPDELAAIAATLGAASNHPVSRALAALLPAEQRLAAWDVRETRGLGIVAHIGNALAALGRPELFQELGLARPLPPAHDGPIAGIARGNRFLGWMLLADEPRPESRQAVADLRFLEFAQVGVSAREQRGDGNFYWTSKFTDTLVSKIDVLTSAQGQGMAKFTPPTGGIYRIVGEGKDANGNTIRSATYQWVAGTGFVNDVALLVGVVLSAPVWLWE